MRGARRRGCDKSLTRGPRWGTAGESWSGRAASEKTRAGTSCQFASVQQSLCTRSCRCRTCSLTEERGVSSHARTAGSTRGTGTRAGADGMQATRYTSCVATELHDAIANAVRGGRGGSPLVEERTTGRGHWCALTLEVHRGPALYKGEVSGVERRGLCSG
jgi:hypothetical protein